MPPIPQWLGKKTIVFEDVKNDPNYVVFENGISYANVLGPFRQVFFPNGGPTHSWNESPMASFYTVNHGGCMAWNYKGKCLPFDKHNPTLVAHKDLPLGTIVSMEFDRARYVEDSCEGFSDTDACFKKHPEILKDAKEAPLEKILFVITDRGPYVEGRDFDVTPQGMKSFAGENLIKRGVLPIRVEIVAVPRRAFDASALYYLAI